MLVLGLVSAASALFPSGLILEAPPKGKVAPAPWIFVAVQGFLQIFPPFFAGVFLPSLALCLLFSLPYFPMKLLKAAKGLGIALLSLWVLVTLAFWVRFSWL